MVISILTDYLKNNLKRHTFVVLIPLVSNIKYSLKNMNKWNLLVLILKLILLNLCIICIIPVKLLCSRK